MPRNKKNKGGGGGNAAPPKRTNDPIPLRAPETPVAAAAAAAAPEDNETLKLRLAEAKDRLNRVEAVIETIGAQRQSTDAAIAEAAQKLQTIGAMVESPPVIAEAPSAQQLNIESSTGTAKKNKKHNKHKVHNLIPPEGYPAAPVPKLDVVAAQKPAAVQVDQQPTPPPATDPAEVAVDKIENQSGKNKKKNKNKNKPQQANPEEHSAGNVLIEEAVAVPKMAERQSPTPISDVVQTPEAEKNVDPKDESPGDGKKKKNKNKNKNKPNKDDAVEAGESLKTNETKAENLTKEADEKPESVATKMEPVKEPVHVGATIQNPTKIEDLAVENVAKDTASHNEPVKTDTVVTDSTQMKKKNKNKTNKHEPIAKDIVEPPVVVAQSALCQPSEPFPIIQECPLQSPKLVQSVSKESTEVKSIDDKADSVSEVSLMAKSEETAPQTKEIPKEPHQLKEEDIKKSVETIWKILDPPTDVAVIEGPIKHKKGHKKEGKSELSILAEIPPASEDKIKPAENKAESDLKAKNLVDDNKPIELLKPEGELVKMLSTESIESTGTASSLPILQESSQLKDIAQPSNKEVKAETQTPLKTPSKKQANKLAKPLPVEIPKQPEIIPIDKSPECPFNKTEKTAEKLQAIADDNKCDLDKPIELPNQISFTAAISKPTKSTAEAKVEDIKSLANEVSTSFFVKTTKPGKVSPDKDQPNTKTDNKAMEKSEKPIAENIHVESKPEVISVSKAAGDSAEKVKSKAIEKDVKKDVDKVKKLDEIAGKVEVKTKPSETANKKIKAKVDKPIEHKVKTDVEVKPPTVETSRATPAKEEIPNSGEQVVPIKSTGTASKESVKDKTSIVPSKVEEDKSTGTCKALPVDAKPAKEIVNAPSPTVLETPKKNKPVESQPKNPIDLKIFNLTEDKSASSSEKKQEITQETKKSPPTVQHESKQKPITEPKAEPLLVDVPLTTTPNDDSQLTTADEPTTTPAKKDAKQKTTKVKSKAPQPPRTEKSPAPSEASSSSASTIVEVGTSSSSVVVDENAPILSDSKNVQRSASVRSADVAAVKGPTTESLQINNEQSSVEAASIPDIKPETVREAKTVSPTTNKRNKNEINMKQMNGEVEAKTQELPEKSAQQKLEPTPTTEVQLMDILEPKMITGTKPGAVAGNVRVKAATAPKKVATVKKEPVAKDTGAIPKTVAAKEKKVSPLASSPIVAAKKQGSPKPETTPKAKSVEKAASPKRDVPLKQGSPKPEVKSTAPKIDTNKVSTPVKTDIKPTPTTKPSVGTKSPTPTAAKTTKSPVKPIVPPRPNNLVPSPTQPKKSSPTSASSSNASTPSPNLYDDEEYIEYKFSPRPVFMSTICQTCKIPLQSFVHCKQCMMISYCTVEHLQEDAESHQPLCAAVQEIAKKRGGHIYNNARILNDDDYRSLRVHTLNLCENSLKRHLQPFEREILLFPRLCSSGPCREWRQHLLTECKICGQVSYCASNPEHLAESHTKWCKAFALYQKLVVTQKHYGRIEPSLPSKIMSKQYQLTATIDDTFRNLYKNYGAIKDECTYAALTQLATAPLTAYYGIQLAGQPIGERFTIHLVGAELQFEADTLDKWETFFMHLVPQLVELRIVFVGPELNAENLPLEILSRIRMCRACRQNCRAVKFDFQCGTLYHSYVKGKAFTKPDMVCFFNPGLYRSTGFNGQDTWPETIQAVMAVNAPVLVTSYTEVEAPRDLDRLQKEAGRALDVLQVPHVNPFASQRPERNFISDEVAPMIFKNFYCFVCK